MRLWHNLPVQTNTKWSVIISFSLLIFRIRSRCTRNLHYSKKSIYFLSLSLSLFFFFFCFSFSFLFLVVLFFFFWLLLWIRLFIDMINPKHHPFDVHIVPNLASENAFLLTRPQLDFRISFHSDRVRNLKLLKCSLLQT